MEQVLDIAGCSRDAFNKWLRRGILRTPFEETVSGRARNFTRENALEVAFLAALARNNCPLEDAVQIATYWLTRESEGNLPGFWIFNLRKPMFDHRSGSPGGTGLSHGEHTIGGICVTWSDRSGGGWEGDDASKTAPWAGASIGIVNLAEILRRVDTEAGRSE